MKFYYKLLIFTLLLLLPALACGSDSPSTSTSSSSTSIDTEQETQIEDQEEVEADEETEQISESTDTPANDPEPTSEPTATPLPPTPTPLPIGHSRSNPYPISEIVNAPNWDVQVLEIVKGEEAWQAIQSANQFNEPPKEGMEYILVKLYVKSTYTDDEAHTIGSSDFRVTGDQYIRYSSASVVEPEPQLDAELFTDGESEGWVAFEVTGGETNLILIVDELFNFDEDRLRFIELEEGSHINIPENLVSIQPTDLGVERSSPAPFGETVLTEEWEITITEVIKGDDALVMVQDANQFNEPPEEGLEYIAVKVLIRYIGTDDESDSIDGSFFKSTGDASVIYDLPSVVDPEPALNIDLFPGGETEGWIIVQSAIDETGMKLIFEPIFDFSGDNKRFISIEP
ncbi:MAG: DUF4352 domain-containing protein [Chloroflexi bacterium]|nr:MAG: DUF4352 domain-containing protein [Chloroflexota bacterium]